MSIKPITLLVAFMAGSAPSSVFSQSSPSDPESFQVLEEIVVTAQKRVQNLQDVPMSVTAISGDSLADHESNTFLDVLDLTVGVDFEQSAEGDETRSTIVTIRGVGSEQNTTGLQPSTTVMIDGEVLSRTAALSGDLVDVEQVEILRGPQGTLYGKNASSGIIHTKSKRPVIGSNDGQVSLLAAQDSEYRINGSLNIPVSDKAALRVNGFYKDFGGYIKNTYPGNPDGGQLEAKGIRAQLLLQPSDTLSVLLRADYSNRDAVPAGGIIVGVDDPTHPIVALTGGRFDSENDTTTLDSTQISSLNSKGISAEVEKTIGDHTLTYTGSYRNWDLWENTDSDRSALRFSELQFGGISESKTMQHELRLTSPEYDKYNYIVGAYYYKTDDFRDAGNARCTKDPATVKINPQTLEVVGCGKKGAAFNRVDEFTTSIGIENVALFGHANYHLTERLTAVVGGRVLNEKTSFDYVGGRKNIPYFETSVSDSAATGRLGLVFDVSDSTMLYATYSTGWKGRAYLNTGNLNPVDIPANSPRFPLPAEEVKQLELGLRSVLLDGRLQFNLTAYQADFENFQERVRFFDELDILQSTLESIPSVLSEGFEVETVFKATQNLKLSASIAHNESTYDIGPGVAFGNCPISFRNTSRCIKSGKKVQLIDLSGKTRPNAPKLSYVLKAKYGFELGESGYNGHVSLGYKYRDSVLKGLDQDPLKALDSLAVANLNMVINSPNDNVSFNLFVKNLFDERIVRARNFNPRKPLGGRIQESLPRNYQRYFGGAVTVRF